MSPDDTADREQVRAAIHAQVLRESVHVDASLPDEVRRQVRRRHGIALAAVVTSGALVVAAGAVAVVLVASPGGDDTNRLATTSRTTPSPSPSVSASVPTPSSAALLPLPVASPSPSGAAPPPEPTRYLGFFEGGHENLFTVVTATGHTVRRLTSDGDQRPYGATIDASTAYWSHPQRVGVDDECRAKWVSIDPRTGAQSPAPFDSLGIGMQPPAVSPDGQWVAWIARPCRMSDTQNPVDGGDLVIHNLRTGAEQRWAEGSGITNEFAIGWSTDGTALLVRTGEQKIEYRELVFDPAGHGGSLADIPVVLANTGKCEAWDAALVGNGAQVVYARNCGGAGESVTWRDVATGRDVRSVRVTAGPYNTITDLDLDVSGQHVIGVWLGPQAPHDFVIRGDRAVEIGTGAYGVAW